MKKVLLIALAFVLSSCVKTKTYKDKLQVHHENLEPQEIVVKKYNEEGNPHAGFTFKYYRRTAYDFAVGKFFEQIDFFPTQPMKLYELSGIYEVRGYM